MPSQFIKDPNAVLDYRWDWTQWLAVGDTISTADVSIADGDVVINSESNTTTAVTAWISEYARRLVIRYDVRNLSHDRRAAHGHTVIATLDADGRLRLETPPEIVARIRS